MDQFFSVTSHQDARRPGAAARAPEAPRVVLAATARLSHTCLTPTLQEAVDQDELGQLTHALAIVIGIESTIVLRDICGLDSAEILRVQHWAARALLAAVSSDAPAD